MVFTWSALVMLPTAIVASPISLRILSANGVWYMRPYTGFWCGTTWPVETSIRSTPASLKARASASRSSSDNPPGAQSVAEIRIDMGFSCGQTARTARNTSSG